MRLSLLLLLTLATAACAEEPKNYAVDYVLSCQDSCTDVCAVADLDTCKAGCEQSYGWTTTQEPAIADCGMEWDAAALDCQGSIACTSDGALFQTNNAACTTRVTAWNTCTQ